MFALFSLKIFHLILDISGHISWLYTSSYTHIEPISFSSVNHCSTCWNFRSQAERGRSFTVYPPTTHSADFFTLNKEVCVSKMSCVNLSVCIIYQWIYWPWELKTKSLATWKQALVRLCPMWLCYLANSLFSERKVYVSLDGTWYL